MRAFSQIVVKDEYHEYDMVMLIIIHLFCGFLFTNNNHTLWKVLVYYIEDHTHLSDFNWAGAIRDLTLSDLDKCRGHVQEHKQGGRPTHIYTYGCPTVFL